MDGIFDNLMQKMGETIALLRISSIFYEQQFREAIKLQSKNKESLVKRKIFFKLCLIVRQ